MKKMIAGIHIPDGKKLLYPNLRPAFMVASIVGDKDAGRGFFNDLEAWIEERIPLSIFADSRALIRWLCANRFPTQYRDSNHVISSILPQAYGYLTAADAPEPESIDQPVNPFVKKSSKVVKK